MTIAELDTSRLKTRLVCVEPDWDTVETGLIITPDRHKILPPTGTVRNCADDAQEVGVGDRVLFDKARCELFDIGGQRRLLLHESHILALI